MFILLRRRIITYCCCWPLASTENPVFYSPDCKQIWEVHTNKIVLSGRYDLIVDERKSGDGLLRKALQVVVEGGDDMLGITQLLKLLKKVE